MQKIPNLWTKKSKIYPVHIYFSDEEFFIFLKHARQLGLVWIITIYGQKIINIYIYLFP